MPPVIRVEHLAKSYITAAGPFPALKGVDLSIQPGEFVAIMGPSGSGKSTFMNLLGCLDTPSEGDYFLVGHNVARLSSDELAVLRNRTIGFVFQGFNLLQRMSLQDNVALPLVYSRVERDTRREKARRMLARVGLESYADSLPSRISGGQPHECAAIVLQKKIDISARERDAAECFLAMPEFGVFRLEKFPPRRRVEIKVLDINYRPRI